MLKRPAISFSKVDENDINHDNVLVIDSVGLLSSVYQYNNIVYVGGGFGIGIHNILEVATYSMPIVLGSNFTRFTEAVDLVPLGSAFQGSNLSTILTL